MSARVLVPIEEYQAPKRNNLRAFKADKVAMAALDQMLALCAERPRLASELGEATGLSPAKVTAVLQRSGRFAEAGATTSPNGNLMPFYTVRPLPADTPGVTVRYADRTGRLEDRALAELGDADRPLSVEQLAARLVVHTRDVAAVVEQLIADKWVVQVPSGERYRYTIAKREAA